MCLALLFYCFFSEDGKDSMKFYTDPGHFFEQWCQQMMAKDAELQTKKHRQRNRKPVSAVQCFCAYKLRFAVNGLGGLWYVKTFARVDL